MKASEFVAYIRDRAAIGADVIEEVFAAIPLDFSVVVTRRLPLLAHRFGAVGITIRRTVYLYEPAIRHYTPTDMLILLRHEAEHVVQQRQDLLFYLRYSLGWITQCIMLIFKPSNGTGSGSLAQRAYSQLPSEIEACAAEERARRLLAHSTESPTTADRT